MRRGGGSQELQHARLSVQRPLNPSKIVSKMTTERVDCLARDEEDRPVAKEVPAVPSGEGWLDTTAPNERLAHVWTIRKQLRHSHLKIVHRSLSDLRRKRRWRREFGLCAE